MKGYKRATRDAGQMNVCGSFKGSTFFHLRAINVCSSLANLNRSRWSIPFRLPESSSDPIPWSMASMERNVQAAWRETICLNWFDDLMLKIRSAFGYCNNIWTVKRGDCLTISRRLRQEDKLSLRTLNQISHIGKSNIDEVFRDKYRWNYDFLLEQNVDLHHTLYDVFKLYFKNSPNKTVSNVRTLQAIKGPVGISPHLGKMERDTHYLLRNKVFLSVWWKISAWPLIWSCVSSS